MKYLLSKMQCFIFSVISISLKLFSIIYKNHLGSYLYPVTICSVVSYKISLVIHTFSSNLQYYIIKSISLELNVSKVFYSTDKLYNYFLIYNIYLLI